MQQCACRTLDACGKRLLLQIGGTNSVGASNCCAQNPQALRSLVRKVAFSATVQLHFYGKPVIQQVAEEPE
jgi:hypothetical protein